VPPPPDVSSIRRIPVAGERGGYRAQEVTCLHVTDDGPGIDERDQSRVFEPFFTTKDVGEGTGLGLAVAHGLVRDNGGWITVESELGQGSRFSIYFPCGGTVR
jgi:signal transduction histidine kinase